MTVWRLARNIYSVKEKPLVDVIIIVIQRNLTKNGKSLSTLC